MNRVKNILILGAGGQLGRELINIYPGSIGLYHGDGKGSGIDLSDFASISEKIMSRHPDVIINAAALANVDRCEKERTYALSVNGYAVKAMVSSARELDIPFIHVSTDYVFDGTESLYSESSTPNPINFYGLSKYTGDIYADSYDKSLIVRTSGVFGYSSNFPKFVYKTLSEGSIINAIPGFYSPIHARNLAIAIKELIDLQLRGIINVAGERISRFELGKRIAETFGFSESLITESAEVKSMIAKRPYDSSLDIKKVKSLLHEDLFSIRSNLNRFRETADR